MKLGKGLYEPCHPVFAPLRELIGKLPGQPKEGKYVKCPNYAYSAMARQAEFQSEICDWRSNKPINGIHLLANCTGEIEEDYAYHLELCNKEI